MVPPGARRAAHRATGGATSPPASYIASVGSGEKMPEAHGPAPTVETGQKDALCGARVCAGRAAGGLVSPAPLFIFTPTFTPRGSLLRTACTRVSESLGT